MNTIFLASEKFKIILTASLAGVSYYFAANLAVKCGLTLNMLSGEAQPFLPPAYIPVLWPANAIILTVLLLSERRHWWIYLVAMTLAYIAASMHGGFTALQFAIFFTANFCEVLVAGLSLRMLLGSQLKFDRLREMAVFLACAVMAGPVVAASIASLAAIVEPELSYWLVWRMWFLSDALGILTLTPILLLWLSSGIGWIRQTPFLGMAECIGLFLCALLVASFATGTNIDSSSTAPALLYTPLPVIFWAVIRFGPRGIGSVVFIITLVTIWNATNGQGPFTTNSPADNAFSLQLFLMAIAVPSMLVGSLLAEHRAAGQDRLQSELRLNEAQQLAMVGSWELDLVNDSLTWSDEIYRMFEVDKTRTEPSYAAFLQMIHPEDRDRVDKAYTESLANRKPYEIQHRLKLDDGRVRYVRESCQTFFDGDGNPLRSVGTVQDITELFKTEEALSAAVTLHKQVVSFSPIGILIYDQNGQCIETNASAAKMLGSTQSQILKLNYNKLDSWKNSGLLASVTRAISNQAEERMELDGKTSFGTDVSLGAHIAPFQMEGKRHILLMFDDISEHKSIQSALSESEARLMKAQAIAKISHWKMNPVTREITGSSKLLGLRNDGLPVDNIFELMPAADRERNHDYLQKAIETGEGWNTTFPIVKSDGVKAWIHAIGETVVDESGKVVEVVGTIQDISERKLAEEQLAKYQYHLEELIEEGTLQIQSMQDELIRSERLTTLGQLTATVAHELRNPLGAIRQSLFILKGKSDQNDEYVQRAEARIDKNIERCDQIIEELLGFTRVTDLNKSSIRFDQWLNSVIDEQEIPQGIQIERNFSLPNTEIPIDTERMRRVVINVIENARHAMRDETNPTTPRKGSRLGFKTSSHDERIEIAITDSGIGMSEDTLEKMFEPLFSTKNFGVGLGMPTIQQIMEQHGGGIEVKSEENKGTTVILWLPKPATEEANQKARG